MLRVDHGVSFGFISLFFLSTPFLIRYHVIVINAMNATAAIPVDIIVGLS